jgi:hypothetical protein
MINKDLGHNILHSEFNTLFSLPLSGGCVSLNFVPDIRGIENALLYNERVLEKVINRYGLSKELCRRYLIAGQR